MACDYDTHTTVRWFNSKLLGYMDLYVETGTGVYVLVEKFNCDILATSRIYTRITGGEKILMPPNAWKNPVVRWKETPGKVATYDTNASNMYAFEGFDDFLSYIKTVRATRNTIPFFDIDDRLRADQLSRLVDADSAPPEQKTFKRTKIYIS
ncbi:hypothetical protein J6590_087506 [Homalodisca vitripennis]|nr:hypothetical protein J6590_087506 [Homalodisca vitripennis]